MSYREIRMTMPARLSLPLLAAAALLWPAVIAQNAAAQTYTPASGTFQWSAGTNWSATPVSGSTTQLTYVGNNADVVAAGTYGSNNDLSGNFRLNRLNLQGTGPGSGNAVINLSGGPLEFVSNGGTAPVINLTASGTSLNYNIANNIVLTNNLSLNGVSTAANYTFSGLISGTGSLSASNDRKTISLTNNASTFTGGVSNGGASNAVLRYSSIADNGIASSLGVGTVGNRIDINQSGFLTYTGSLDQSSNRRIRFAGSNTSWLATSGSLGTLTLSNVVAGNNSSLGLDAAAGTTIVITNSFGADMGTGRFSKNGPGTAIITTAQNYTGGVSLIQGTLVIGSVANAGTASAIGSGTATINMDVGAVLKYIGSGHSTDRLLRLTMVQGSGNFAGPGPAIDASGSGALKFTSTGTIGQNSNSLGTFYLTGTSTADNTFAPVLPNTANNTAVILTKYGTGKWILTGSNTYTGQTRVYNGSLVLNAATGAISGSSAVAFGGGQFTFDNIGATGALTIASGTLTATAGDGVMTFARTADQDVGITFAGNSRANGATVNLAHGGGANSAANGFSITGAALGFVNRGLFFSGADYAYMNSAGGFVRAPVYGTDSGFVNASGSLTTGVSNHNLVQASLTGVATSTVATIKFSGASAVNLTQATNATLTLAQGGLLRAGGGSTTISGGTLSVSADGQYVFRVDSASDSLTISSVIGATGENSLTKSGAGTLTLGGANVNTGATFVNGGTLEISSNGNLGLQSSGQSVNINNGTLRATADVGLFNGTAGTNNRNVVITNAATFDVAANRTLTIAGVVSGSNIPGYAYMLGGGRLTKTGGGTLSLSNVNTYTGDTTISAGVLAITAGGINSTSGITIGGGELKYNSSTPLAAAVPLTFSAGMLSGTGTINTPVTVAANTFISPGNSPGIQAYSSGLTWNPDGTYVWETNALTGTAGTNWDMIAVSGGALNLSGLSSGNRFVLDLTTLGAGDTPGTLVGGYEPGTYAFDIATFSSLLVPDGYAASANSILTDLFSFNELVNWQGTQPSSLTLKVNSSGDGLQLNLVIVPEPGAIALAGIGIAAAAYSLRRRSPSRKRVG